MRKCDVTIGLSISWRCLCLVFMQCSTKAWIGAVRSMFGLSMCKCSEGMVTDVGWRLRLCH